MLFQCGQKDNLLHFFFLLSLFTKIKSTAEFVAELNIFYSTDRQKYIRSAKMFIYLFVCFFILKTDKSIKNYSLFSPQKWMGSYIVDMLNCSNRANVFTLKYFCTHNPYNWKVDTDDASFFLSWNPFINSWSSSGLF